MDLSTVTFFTNAVNEIQVSAITQNCFECNFMFLGNVSSSKNFTHIFDTRWPTKLEFLNSIFNESLRVTEHFVENGEYVYSIQVTPSNSFVINNKITNNPPPFFLPLIYLLSALVVASVLWPLAKLIYRKMYRRKETKESDYFLEMDEWESKIDIISELNRSPSNPIILRTARFRSLDTFRGIAIVLMVFVNYGGGQYHFIDRAIWDGLSISDLVFPWFVFIMGVNINLSHRRLQIQEKNKKQAFLIILPRSIKLFMIGFVLNSGKNLATWRIPGVLQRIGICYFVVATFNLFVAPSEKTLEKFSSTNWVSNFRDIIPFGFQWLFILFLITVHTAITFCLPVPGCPTGYLGPGGLAEGGKYFNCTGGAAGYIDRLVLGEKHLYRNPTFKSIYLTTQNYDAEGLLGYLTSIVLTFFGLQTGRILYMYESHRSQVTRWFIWALVTGCIALVLTKGTLQNGVIPINKSLWSLSFVMGTGSISFALFSFCYILCDSLRVWNGSPFFFCGVNSMFIYIGQSLLTLNVFWDEQPITHASSVGVALFGTVVWVFCGFWLRLKKFLFTV